MAAPAAAGEDLTDMSLESLMDVEVTSAAKKPQLLHETTTAIDVITGEEIRRAGATTLAEALRLAPGVDVIRSSNNQWAVGVRGLSNFPYNKLQVLIDGRSIYSLLNAGVFWNRHDTLIGDIERIEVIRGPGGTLWGANAVNGVINIITKDAAETQGGHIQAGAGTRGNHITSFRYGGQAGEDTHYRVYGKHSDHGNLELADGSDAADDWNHSQAGGRLDWQPTPRDEVTVQGDFFTATFDQPSFLPITSFFQPLPVQTTTDQIGGNIMAGWERNTTDYGKFSLQSYVDWYDTEGPLVTTEEKVWNLEFEHRFSPHDRVDLIWGAGYRLLSYDSRASLAIDPDPLGGEFEWLTGFVQGDFQLTPSVRLTLGSKFEHNELSGFEYQPNARLLWHPHEDYAFWASASRAVRTSAPSDHRVRINIPIQPGTPFSPPILFALLPNAEADSEELIAWELGARFEFRHNLSLDLTGFYFDYDDLIIGVFQPPVFESDPPPPHLLFSSRIDNEMYGEIYGLEGALNWRPHENWRLEASYSVKKADLHTDNPDVIDLAGFGGPSDIEKSSPEQQFQIRSYLDLPHNLEADVSFFYVDEIDAQMVDDYTRLDLHLGWKPFKRLRLDLFARNLLEDSHTESFEFMGSSSRIPRSLFGRVTWEW